MRNCISGAHDLPLRIQYLPSDTRYSIPHRLGTPRPHTLYLAITWLAGVIGALFILCCSALPAPATSRTDSSDLLARIKEYHGELKDMSAMFQIKNENADVLSNISPDFAEFVKYGFRQFKYYYKNPDKVRIESTATLFHFLKGISERSGDKKNFYIPSLHIHRTADVTGQANKKETALDFGIMTGDIWEDYNVWYIRTEKSNGSDVHVIGLQPKNEPHGGTMIVRLDAESLKMLERDRYNGKGDLKQRQTFSNYLHPLPHVWIPTDIKLYNNVGQFGGELIYTRVTINTSLADNLFQ